MKSTRILILLASLVLTAAFADVPDKEVGESGRKQLTELNYSPIPIFAYSDKAVIVRLIDGHIAEASGAVVELGGATLRDGKWDLADGDVFFNVGKSTKLKVGEIEIGKGECVLFKQRLFKKLNIKITHSSIVSSSSKKDSGKDKREVQTDVPYKYTPSVHNLSSEDVTHGIILKVYSFRVDIDVLSTNSGKIRNVFASTVLKGGNVVSTVNGEGDTIQVFDTLGAYDIQLQVANPRTYAQFAGLVFRESCVLGILRDGTVYANRAGVLARREGGGEAFVSRAVSAGVLTDSINPKHVFAFYAKEELVKANTDGGTPEPEPVFENKPDFSPLPPYTKGTLSGTIQVRVRNPNGGSVKVGLRSGGQGINFNVPADTTASVYVPSGEYDVYFVYSADPKGLYKGDSFTLVHNGVEIQIVEVVDGNFKIRRVN